MSARARIQGLDALRGAAVGLVLVFHAWPGLFVSGGVVGVTIFFTLSGYLITGIVRREVERRGQLSFRAFYRNRAVRLLPALAVLLLVFAVVDSAVGALGQRPRVLPTVLAGVFYAADLPGVPFATGMSHLWTLSVEEQFYLVWPAAVVLAMRRRRLGALVGGALCLWLVVCAGSVLLAPGGPHQVYTLPTTWAVAMLLGAALEVHRERLPRVGRAAAAGGAVVLASATLLPLGQASAATYLLLVPAVAATTCALLTRAARTETVSPALQPLSRLGLISYAAYLWNFPALGWLHAVLGHGPAASWLSLPATVLLAAASWVAVEVPAQRWKARPRVVQVAPLPGSAMAWSRMHR